jgi:hypothetical protein
MPMDEGGPGGCLLRYRTTKGVNGRVLFICSHGGWDRRSMVGLPPGSQMWFYGTSEPPDATITAGRCYEVMRSGEGISPTSIAGGTAEVWDYTMSEFQADWQGAIEAVEDAKANHKGANDCVMVRDGVSPVPVKLSMVFAAFPGYHAYAWMACRVGHQPR